MDVKTIESLARLMKETGLTSLKLSEGETSLKLERLPMGGIALAEAPAATGAQALGVPVVWARGLPGKVAPHTAAEYLKDTVYHIMEELGV